MIGLLPHFTRSGRKWETNAVSRKLIHEVLETHYDTVTRKPKGGAYGEYLKRAEEQHLVPLSPRTFCREVESHKAAYDQTVSRKGTCAAYLPRIRSKIDSDELHGRRNKDHQTTNYAHFYYIEQVKAFIDKSKPFI